MDGDKCRVKLEEKMLEARKESKHAISYEKIVVILEEQKHYFTRRMSKLREKRRFDEKSCKSCRDVTFVPLCCSFFKIDSIVSKSCC